MFTKVLYFAVVIAVVFADDKVVKKRSPDDRLQISHGSLNYKTLSIPTVKPETVQVVEHLPVVEQAVVAHEVVPQQIVSHQVIPQQVQQVVSHQVLPQQYVSHQVVPATKYVPAVEATHYSALPVVEPAVSHAQYYIQPQYRYVSPQVQYSAVPIESSNYYYPQQAKLYNSVPQYLKYVR